MERLGLGVDRGQLTEEEDEFSTYRKRMMLSYKFRPNPMVNSITISKNIMQRTMYRVLFLTVPPKKRLIIKKSKVTRTVPLTVPPRKF